MKQKLHLFKFKNIFSIASRWRIINVGLILMLLVSMCQFPRTEFLSPVPTALPATEITNNSFQANWKPLVGVTTFFLDVATDINFQNILPNYNNKAIQDTTEKVVGLEIGTTYYYRVRSRNADNTISNNSNIIALTLSNEVNAPEALAPIERTALRFVARWRRVSVATSYRLEVAKDTNFTEIVPDYNGVNLLDTFAIIKNLDSFEAKYYYRVRAIRLNFISPYSNTVVVLPAVTPNCRIFDQVIDNTSNPVFGDRQIFTYDAQGRVVTIEHRGKPIALGGSAANENQGQFTNTGYGTTASRRHIGAIWTLSYNAQNQITQGVLTKNFAPNIGRVLERRTFTYNSQGKVSQVLVDGFDATTGLLYVKRRWEIEYDEKGRVKVWKDFDITNTETLAGKYTYTYNQRDQPIEMVYERNEPAHISNSNIVGTYTYRYKYDENLNPLALLRRQDYAFFVLTNYMPRYKPMITLNNVVEELVGVTLTPNLFNRSYFYGFELNSINIATKQLGVPDAYYSLMNCN
ncbi:MAG: fibronectin type III domain-containing protein [Microscillaceae bacterium]|nr:fibronectin type III domain-containing protein [Microscillaceae bacterium]MDW8460338.1 hypothetical protein [Cytophagales bacterium]